MILYYTGAGELLCCDVNCPQVQHGRSGVKAHVAELDGALPLCEWASTLTGLLWQHDLQSYNQFLFGVILSRPKDNDTRHDFAFWMDVYVLHGVKSKRPEDSKTAEAHTEGRNVRSNIQSTMHTICHTQIRAKNATGTKTV